MKSDLTHQFKKDYRQVKYSGKYQIKEIDNTIEKLVNQLPLELRLCDHELSGNLKGIRECHVFPDLLLMYRYVENGIILIRLGSHSELFE